MTDTKEKEMNEKVIKEENNVLPFPVYESATLGKLFQALAKAQLEMEVAKTESSNPFFKSKYADLSTVVKASRPYLAKNGLSVIQRVLSDSQGLVLHSRLCHSSGEWIASEMPIQPPKSDIQSLGSYITYLRRYTYAALCGVVASDEDDDGEANMVTTRISVDQKDALEKLLKGQGEIRKKLFSKYKLTSLSQLPEGAYEPCMERIKTLINQEEEK